MIDRLPLDRLHVLLVDRLLALVQWTATAIAAMAITTTIVLAVILTARIA